MSARTPNFLRGFGPARLILLVCFEALHGAQAAGSETNDIPPLRPPRAEIPPGWWERHGTQGMIVLAVVVILLGVLIWWLMRARPKALLPPETIATSTLSKLRDQTENGAILSQVSRAVRQYFGAAFGLPPREMTTREFCEAVQQQAEVGRPLAEEVSQFLQECDRRKFERKRELVPMGAAARALGLVESAEKRRAEVREAQAAVTGGKAS